MTERIWCSQVDGKPVQTGNKLGLIDPSNDEQFGVVDMGDAQTAEAAVRAARRAFDDGRWSGLDPATRQAMMLEVSNEVMARLMPLAELESISAGITMRAAPAMHIGWGAMHLTEFANAANRSFVTALPPNEVPFPSMSYLVREPVGVTAGIVPWNAPFLMAVWKVGPALAMGNTVVLKPAPNTPLTALELANIIAESDIPDGVVNVVTGGADVGHALASSPLVDKIAFTGSTAVGKSIMTAAAGTLKRVSLELGGKSANIVCADADLDLAADGTLFGFLLSSGQGCESGTRILVDCRIYEDFVGRLLERIKRMKIGPASDPTVDVGPLSSKAHLESVHRHVEGAIADGARVLCGGRRASGFDRGCYYEPTLLEVDGNHLRICQEEVFGPVATIMAFSDEDEAIAIANDSTFGLAGGVWTTDIGRGMAIARRVRTGTMWVNDWHTLIVGAPFGGIKDSGIGKELGEAGFDEYLNVKHINVALAPHAHRPYPLVVPPATAGA
ncbi:Betaine-aldehyde dehydrogenase [Mycolicibacterium rhodesiae JS60]|nr:Betaine-aldehyde dehydrogenase [Mycolicibacterium rhodesiae JS60]